MSRRNGKKDGPPTHLGLVQMLALRTVTQELATARQRFEQVMRECGLDPAGEYHIADDGTVITFKGIEAVPAGDEEAGGQDGLGDQAHSEAGA